MKISILLFITDILPSRKRFLNQLVKNKLFNNLTPDKALAHLKNNGFDGIELLLTDFVKENDVEEIKKLVNAHGLKINSVHQSLRFLTKTRLSEIRKILQISKTLESEVIVLHMSSAGKQLFNPSYVEEIHKLQKEFGIKIGFENREKFFGSLLDAYGWDEKEFSDLMQKENLYITYDVCHMGVSGGDIVRFFNHNKDRIVNIHLSDYRPNIWNHSIRPIRYKHMPLGKGVLPIKELLNAIKKSKYNGNLTLEINTNLNDLIESAHIIRNNT